MSELESEPEHILRESGNSSLNKAITDNLYGLKSHSGEVHIKPDRDHHGLTFVVRPALALTETNCRSNPDVFLDLLTEDKYSVWRYLRGLLDPHFASKYPEEMSPLLDNRQAFIPFLTNGMVSVSGWRSETLPTRETNPGLAKEQIVLPDGFMKFYGNFDLDLNVKNGNGSPIDKMLKVWTNYMSLNHLGQVMPYPFNMAGLYRDYTTRVYRLVLSEDGLYVKHIAATAGCFPVNTENGKVFDYNVEEAYPDIKGERTIRMSSTAPIYDDIRLMTAFNWTVGVFHPGMRNLTNKVARKEELEVIKIPPELRHTFRHRMYPHINLLTYELEWYANKEDITDKAPKVYGPFQPEYGPFQPEYGPFQPQ